MKSGLDLTLKSKTDQDGTTLQGDSDWDPQTPRPRFNYNDEESDDDNLPLKKYYRSSTQDKEEE